MHVYCYGAVVPGYWVVPGLRCASSSAIPLVCVGVWALLSLCSGTPLGLLKVSRRFTVAWILWAVWLSLFVFSLKILQRYTCGLGWLHETCLAYGFVWHVTNLLCEFSLL